MVLRCFARRHLVPARGMLRSHGRLNLSTSAVVRQQMEQQEGEDATTSGVNVGRQSKLQPNFFSSTSSISQAFVRDNKVDDPGTKSFSKAIPKHHSVIELYSELYGDEVSSSPERVWNLYMAIFQAAEEQIYSSSSPSSSSSQPINLMSLDLSSKDHRYVLRAIAQKTEREQRKALNESELFSYRYEGSQLRSTKMESNEISQYVQRVAFIFSQLRRSERPNLPGIQEYDHVLERLAPSGNMPALTALWAQLSGSSALDFSSSRKKDIARQIDTMPSMEGVQPSSRTYVHLMLGISRHLAGQIERAHRQHITHSIWRGEGKKSMRKKKESAAAASKGTALYGQEVAPRARLAVQLASARTVSLMRDMFERGVEPEKLTLDLALRMLRMDGNLKGIRMLIKGVFAIDLDNPDTDPRATEASQRPRLHPDVHTLNTLMMAFGEHGTISEMVTAYETISRPLPTKNVEVITAIEHPSNLFATDWRGIFQKDAPVTSESGANTTKQTYDEATVYSHPLAVAPNTTTLTVMIKHCCTAPSPNRMVALPVEVDKRRSQIKAADHLARQQGEYLDVASYLLSEAIDWQEQEIVRVASQIGVPMPDVEAVRQKVMLWTQECETRVDKLPVEMDSYDFVRKASDEGAASVLAEEALTTTTLSDNFVPFFLPPRVTVNFEMVQPLSSHASRRRTADFSRWRWIISQTQRTIANKVIELQVLNRGIEQWETIRLTSGDESGSHLSKLALRKFITALRKQRRMVRGEITQLGNRFVESLMVRFATLRYQRRQRKIQRVAKKEEKAMELEATRIENEAKKLKAALQREERQLQEDATIIRETGGGQVHQEVDHDVEGSRRDIAAIEPVFK